jgi:hypothetical protein
MRSQVNVLHDDAGRYARVYVGLGRDLVLRYLNCLKGTVLSPRTQHRQAEIIHGLGVQMAMVLDGPLRKPIARVRAIWEVDRLIKDTDEPIEREPHTDGRQALNRS